MNHATPEPNDATPEAPSPSTTVHALRTRLRHLTTPARRTLAVGVAASALMGVVWLTTYAAAHQAALTSAEAELTEAIEGLSVAVETGMLIAPSAQPRGASSERQRLALFDADGKMLGASEKAAETSASPEVRDAMKDGLGVDVRSDGQGRETLYVARRAVAPDGGVRVVRLARSLGARGLLLDGLGLSLGLGALMSLFTVVTGVGVLGWLAEPAPSPSSEAASAAPPPEPDADEGDEAPSEVSESEAEAPTPDVDAASSAREGGRTASTSSSSFRALMHDPSRMRDTDHGGLILATVLDAMTEGVLVCDASGNVGLVNVAARELLRLSGDVEGRPVAELYPSPAVDHALEETLRGGQAIHQELVLDLPEGTLFLSIAAAPIRGDDRVEGAVAVMHDITKIRKLERIRRDFVANVSHELRTPLATITGYAETLLSGAVELDPIAVDFVETIERNAKRLTVMVQDLLVLAKLEAQGDRPALEPLRLFAVVSEIMDAVELKADEKGVDLVVEVDGVPAVMGEQRALAQVIRNLVENAIKYTASGGCITIQAQAERDAEGDAVVLQISDTGIGMESVHLPRIFERFYRVDEGRSRSAGGTGLGLAIAKHMVHAMHGQIGVESKPGEGSTFTVRLKAADAQEA